MARLMGIVREEVKPLIATLIFISIWHNDTEYHERLWEKRFYSSKTQPLLLSAGMRGNTAPAWPLGAKRRWEEVGVVSVHAGSCPREVQHQSSAFAKNLFCQNLFREWFEDWILFTVFLLNWLTHLPLLCNSQIFRSRWGETGELFWSLISQ